MVSFSGLVSVGRGGVGDFSDYGTSFVPETFGELPEELGTGDGVTSTHPWLWRSWFSPPCFSSRRLCRASSPGTHR